MAGSINFIRGKIKRTYQRIFVNLIRLQELEQQLEEAKAYQASIQKQRREFGAY